ncbi:MAG: PSD1 domain-containing protein [Pirellulaceae bacterium]|nr:PSD1 domain-containing protein [Pirellulaceae bacterium]
MSATCFLISGATAAVAGDEKPTLPPPITKTVDYAKDVHPILQKHCYKCHGPNKQESSFRLDQKGAALRGGDWGDKPLVVGKSEESPLIKAVAGLLPDLKMPPEGKRLTAEEIGVLRAWVDQGLSWPDAGGAGDKLTTDYWSFQPVKVALPKATADSRAMNLVDGYLLDKLRDNGLDFSPPADRVSLIRRLYFDVIGLPPSPQEVASFVADVQPDAYERLIDQLLASPRHGERWARHWLDVVRFAETNGFETNTPRPEAYPYRDYVIRALNADKPYDRFVFEQIAGDSVREDAATGYLVAGPMDQVKSPDPNLTMMQRQDELADIVSVTGMTFLGLTTGCARCHNHKFDPITQQDYYSLQAVFAGVQHGTRPMRTPLEKSRDTEIAALQKSLSKVDYQLRELEQAHEPLANVNDNPLADMLRPAVNSRVNSERFVPVKARFVRFTIEATNSSEPCLDELEVYTSDPATSRGRAAPVAQSNKSGPDAKSVRVAPVNLALATAGTKVTSSGNFAGFAIHKLEHVHDGKYGNSQSWISNTPGSGWVLLELKEPAEIERIVWGRDRNGAYADRLAVKYRIEVAEEVSINPLQRVKEKWQLVASSADRVPLGSAAANAVNRFASLPVEQRTKAESLAAEIQRLTEKLKSLQNVNIAYAGTFSQPGATHRLYRGDSLQKREEVPPDALEVISSLNLKTDASEQARRVALANWLVKTGNPLPARVMANRLWQHHFGTGIVATPSDFGKNGIPPTHPELLDRLASELIRGGWSLKRLHRLILTSAAYRQSSRPQEKGLAVDASSRLLWRYPPRRLEAEVVRDSVLAVAGSLDLSMHGPGYSVFLPNDNYVRVYNPKSEWTRDEWRRMVYMTKVRIEQDPIFGALDCPDAGQATARRSRSTTALQALNLFNSPFMLQQSELLAAQVKTLAGDDTAAQTRQLFLLTFSREPSDEEQRSAMALIQEHGLSALCRAVLNANEFVFVP